MKRVRKHFTQDHLISLVSKHISRELSSITNYKKKTQTLQDCVLSALAMFTFKHSSLLKFDRLKSEEEGKYKNIKKLFGIKNVPCDTHMRTILDEAPNDIVNPLFKKIFTLLQRANVLNNFLFLEKYYLVSVDGTEYFSSKKVQCEKCLVREHRNGSKTYHHQMLSAALVHPGQKVVFPLCPEPIANGDGSKKNDCERNAFKRWIKSFRKDHPHLNVIIVADGLSSNAPFIKELSENNCKYILVCKDTDHKYLLECLNASDNKNATTIEAIENDIHKFCKYMHDAPLNESNQSCRVNVIRYKETKLKTNKTTTWMWVTNLPVRRENIGQIIKGGRSRWKVENETFNTLKNQGYNFEHNYGHGCNNLSTIFALLMMLAFFIDQCLQRCNKLFQEAYAHCGAKYSLWEEMRAALKYCVLDSFECMYIAIAQPPPQIELNE